MNAPANIRTSHRSDFPGIGADWHYLDSAATAQKSKPVLDAIARAYGPDYATVHRGVYARSANMTLAYEAARKRVAGFLNAASENEIVFTSGATDSINLVAESWGNKFIAQGDRIMLSQLEHHSNIVPWQMLAERVGAQIDVAPLTEDGQIDLDWIEENLTERHKLVALAHVSNVLGSLLDAKRAAAIAHKVGAKLLLDGCQAAPRLPVDVQELGCDFYVFSGHKIYGPTGIGALWAPYATLEAMPPWKGGGSMIDRVSFDGTTYAPPPGRFEAGTPHIAGVVGLDAAIQYASGIGMDVISDHENATLAKAREALSGINSVRVFGPDKSMGILSFAVGDVHPHDVATILDEGGVAIRAGHHCAQPLMDYLGVPATARASFGIYSDDSDVAALVDGINRVRTIFG
ncbi:MAG: cysteine desulfurase [Sphingomonadales bacterium]|nr:cysteine desulfurase [Sphingomonadales bacterium]PIX65857.1 MAG: cysteine desulfurase [Sphingomonadales bacterium CG_4_10_14_3_um_filter_58_15]NCO50368.1 cysteine desulfurase [Sphingomonadales bacterium]NCO99046.1 cysteine desulfurase [Sphingomonadales bacterium]NCP25591.1 cysteine desulfurase [Sphingomonadales bacterium]